MGIEKQKKNGWFFSSSEGGGHPEYITAIFLLVFPQAGVWEGLIACNEFWNDSLTLWAVGLSCGMCLERRTGHIYLYKEIHPQLVILAVLMKTLNITLINIYISHLNYKRSTSNFDDGVNN